MTPRMPTRIALRVTRTLVAALAVAALAPAVAGAVTEPAPAPAAPANDNIAAAQLIRSLPATLAGTTVGATSEPGEADSSCGQSTMSSVWYTIRSSGAQRVAVDLAAGGALDGTIDVYHALRSQRISVGCQATDSKGRASLSFAAAKNGVYEIRVAALANSQLAPFTLDVFLPTPAVSPPGLRLPAAGISGQVDRIQNINAAYSFQLRAGVSYLINLADKTKGVCVSGGLFAPGTRSFEEGSPLLHVGCGGYRLFTPGPGQGGRYSFQVTPRFAHSGVQRFHLQIAPAGPAETAPGLLLGNYGDAHGYLDGSGVRVLRLYRLDITTHSNLTLKLKARQSADFNLQLRNQNGQVIECQCGGSGSQTLQHQLAPGRYYAVVSVRDASTGSFSLVRESRSITSTAISFGTAVAHAGGALGIRVAVTPAVSGPVTVKIERFDPVFGWQFYRLDTAFARGGTAVVAFTPPAVGRWRAKAEYGGSRTASPSAVGFTYLLVS